MPVIIGSPSAMPFLHGVDVIEIDNGPRPIRTVRSSVIGVIGSAPDANAERFPLNTPVLIAGRRSDAVGLGETGTLPPAINDIFDQTGALIVVVRVALEAPPDDGYGSIEVPLLPNGVDPDTGQYLGVSAFLAAESEVHVVPRILIAPELSHSATNVNTLLSVAERLRGVVIADGPNTNDADAISFRENFGDARLFIVDPWAKVANPEAQVPLPPPDTPTEIIRPLSARTAGLIAKVDADRGFWWSPSNNEFRGVLGLARSVDFALGDPNARANLLNENEVATVIQKNGFRLWGNRTTSSDPKWAFLSVRRTADMINESLLRAHMWAVDRSISKTYLEDVLEGVNAYLRQLRTQGAIINGRAWADPERNTPSEIAAGRVHIDFDFTPPYPAESITFRSHLVNDYLTEVLPDGS